MKETAEVSAEVPELRSPAGPSRREVLEALASITASAGFLATDRTRRLLHYLVTETLEGRGNRIKAYSIATEVLGRPESFDPQRDPIVRIEASRLRRELERYYLTSGQADAVRIEIPKGAYIPHFTFGNPEAGAAEHDVQEKPAVPTSGAETARNGRFGRGPGLALSVVLVAGLFILLAGWLGWLTRDQAVPTPQVHVPALLVKPIADLSYGRESGTLAQGLTERIMEKLARFRELAVIAGDSGAQVPAGKARYEFGGTVRSAEGSLLVQTRLADRTDGRVIWAESFEVPLDPRRLFDVEAEIANQIATRIGEPSGIVFQAEGRALAENPPDNWNAYVCTLSAYAYRATAYPAGQHAAVRDCLERAVAEYPGYATAWALLSLSYVDEIRFFYPPSPGQAVPASVRAHDAARRAVELDPANVRAQQALMMALFFRNDHVAAIEVGRNALSLNPNDIELKGELGYRLALHGDWDEGCRLVAEALSSSARKTGYYKAALALCAYFQDDLPAAANLIRDADAQDNPAYHVIAAAILAELGDPTGAAQHRDWLDRNASGQLQALLSAMPQRLVQEQDRRRFVKSLQKAGLPAEE